MIVSLSQTSLRARTSRTMLSTSEIEQKSADALRKVDVAFRRTAIEFRRGDQGLEVWWAPGKEFDATQLGNYSDARVVGVSKKVTPMLFDSCDLMNDSERESTHVIMWWKLIW